MLLIEVMSSLIQSAQPDAIAVLAVASLSAVQRDIQGLRRADPLPLADSFLAGIDRDRAP